MSIIVKNRTLYCKTRQTLNKIFFYSSKKRTIIKHLFDVLILVIGITLAGHLNSLYMQGFCVVISQNKSSTIICCTEKLVLYTQRTTPPVHLPLVGKLKACMTGFPSLAQTHKPQHRFVLTQFSSPGPDSPVELFQFRKDNLFSSLSDAAAMYCQLPTLLYFSFLTYVGWYCCF